MKINKMVNLDERIGKEEDLLMNEYHQSFCSICIFSPGEKAYTKEGLKCSGFTYFEDDFDKTKSLVYPLPRNIKECPYFNK